MTITDAAVARPDIDEARTAMMGGSFGGYMANWIAGHTDRFVAIVSHAGLWVLDQMFGTTDLPSYWRRIFGDPVTQPERYAANSPNRGRRDPHADAGDPRRQGLPGPGGRGAAPVVGRPRPGAGRPVPVLPGREPLDPEPGNAAIWYETVLAFLAQHVLGEEWRRPGLL